MIDLHDLAGKLELVRPGGRGNYRSPHHDDVNPSLSIFEKDGQWGWKDFSADVGGSCIDLVMYVESITEIAEAVDRLHELYQIPKDDMPERELKGLDLWADNYRKAADKAKPYLIEKRGIAEKIIDQCIKRGTLGYDDYTNPKFDPGSRFHGGPAAAFIVRGIQDRFVKGIDYRYFDPELNGGLKTKSQGDKDGFPWIPDPFQLERANTVYLVESAINALSIMSCELPYTAAIATRGTGNTNMDWRFLRGKLVVCCMDNDDPIDKGPRKGERPGPQAAWALHETLTALDIACVFVDQWSDDWDGINDINDYLREHGEQATRFALKRYEQWLIPGLPCGDDEATRLKGRPRVYLPPHDYTKYFLFRVKLDHSQFVKISKGTNADGGEAQQMSFEDLCGFRVAALTRIRIASATAAMSGDKDLAPRTLFCASVQSPRYGNALRRKVFTDEKLYNPDQWREFGALFNTTRFARMINLLERTTHLGARDAVNFVGLAWQDGKLLVNEGADTYFTDPEKQCPYSNLSFPTGPIYNAKKVLSAYQHTFSDNAALQCLVWALGAHLKAFLGFWPHMNMQADKGSGKSTLINRMERTIGFTMFGAQSLQTEFRLLTSMSHTSHPVGWEEISTRRQDVIDKAVAMLQESYQFTVTRRGSDMTEFLMSAPVLLAGEDVPVDGLTGKLVRVELKNKGSLIPENLPVFPVKEWLSYLAGLNKDTVLDKFNEVLGFCQEHCSADRNADHGAERMVGNYAAILTAWRFLTDFADIPKEQGGFIRDLITQMNTHINETKARREPWVWIIEIILGELDAKRFDYPHKFEKDFASDEVFLFIKCTSIMQHLSTTTYLRDKYNALTIKSPTVLRKQLTKAGALVATGKERTIDKVRTAHLEVLSLAVLNQYGLTVSLPEEIDRTNAEASWQQMSLAG